MAPNVPAEQKMYEHEISGQLATFMFAGTDTTA
jgi:cytochrome P450